MKYENEKKGLIEHLTGNKKAKKGSCCCNFEIEEIPEKNTDSKDDKTEENGKGGSCCK